MSDPEDDDASFFGAGRVGMAFMFTNPDGSAGWQTAFSANPAITVPVPYRVTVYAICAFVEE